MVNKPLIGPYFWGGTLGGGRLTSHESIRTSQFLGAVGLVQDTCWWPDRPHIARRSKGLGGSHPVDVHWKLQERMGRLGKNLRCNPKVGLKKTSYFSWVPNNSTYFYRFWPGISGRCKNCNTTLEFPMDPVVPPKKIQIAPKLFPYKCIQSSGSERIHRVGS